MDERQLKYAAAIREAGNLRKAALLLDRESSTMARSLKRLEKELGISIFRRGTTGLSVTREGETFFLYAENALFVLDSMGWENEGNLTEREIEYLTEIRRQKGIARASKILYISQPSLSQILAKIENRLGAELFYRNSGGVEETERGRRFLDQAEELADIFRKLRRELEEFQEMKKGLVSFGIPINLGTSLLPKVLPRFASLYPGVEVIFHENNSVELDKMVLNGKTDFNIMHFQEKKENLNYEKLEVDPFCLAVPAAWRIKLGLPKPDSGYEIGGEELKGLESFPFVMVSRGQKLRQTADGILAQANVKPEICCTTKSMETAKRLCAEGMGLTLLPRSYLNLFSDTKGLCCYPLREELNGSWTIVAVYPREGILPRCSREFLRLLKMEMS